MFHLVPYLSLLENILLAAPLGQGGRTRANELLEQFGLAKRAASADELSAGERQRCGSGDVELSRRAAGRRADRQPRSGKRG